jgi:chromosome segregation ATPase
MNMKMNELKQQLAALNAEQETIENSLPMLEAEWRNSPSNYSPIGNMIGSPESREAMDRYSSAQCRLRAIPSSISRIEEKMAYLERIEQVDEIKAKSIQTMSQAAAEVEALKQTQSNLSQRLQTIQSDSQQSLEKAQQAERDAASLYARSLANGDSDAEKAANGEMQKAAKQLATTDEHVRRQELIMEALQAELDSLETQIANAQQREDDAKQSALNAVKLMLEAEWNAATEHLVGLGAQILAAENEKGNSGYGFSKLDVPRFGPFHSDLRRSDLVTAARAITLEDLLAA